MSPRDVFRMAARSGVTLEAEGGDLFARPASNVIGDLLQALRAGKAALVDWLSQPACPGWQAVPPADLPLREAGIRLTGPQRDLVLDFVARQTGGEPSDLSRWLIRRADLHFQHGKALQHADVAAALDLAVWQLGLDPSQTVAALEAFEEASL